VQSPGTGKTTMPRRQFDPTCAFCSPKVDTAIFAESNDVGAIYNVSPILPGHSLVVPRFHVASVIELTRPEVGRLFVFAQQITAFLEQVFKGSGFNWTIQDAPIAGQTVPHLHLHIIPRKSGDLPEPGDWYPALRANEVEQVDDESRSKLSPKEFASVTAHLRQAWEERQQKVRGL
jgi:bis(5'-adenosyl)-triphosphatase